jgi:hypothetical protein
MMRRFAVALIATTMLVAPALAADAVKSTPAAPVAAATTAAPTVTSAPKDVSKTDKHLKTIKVAHRHPVRHMTFAKNGKHPSHVMAANVSKPVKTVKATPAASPATWFPWTVTKTDQHPKTLRVAHHHAPHLMVAKKGKHATHVKTAEVTTPIKAVTAAPAVSTSTPVVSTPAKPAVKVIKAGKNLKKTKVAHHHAVRHPAIAENGRPASHVKTVKVSKPVKHDNPSKTHKQVAHLVKSSKVIAN